MQIIIRIVYGIVLFSLFYACSNWHDTDDTQNADSLRIEIEQIKKRGNLVVLTNFNSTDYFIYKGEPMGFQYDLMKLFAKKLGVKLEIKIFNDIDALFQALNNKEGDIIAANLTITKQRLEVVNFTEPHTITRQILVQRKPKGWEKMSQQALDSKLIRNQIDLGGKTVFVRSNSSFVSRLQHLSEEIGENIIINEIPEIEAEQLIAKLVDGEIDFTVCDENVAKANSTYYPEIDVETAISFPQKLAWAVRKNSNGLRKEINEWLSEISGSVQYKIIYNKYFNNSKTIFKAKSEFSSLKGSKLSPYDNYIKKYAQKIGWDWLLLASLIYEESHFDHELKSWAGAYGLMQLMPQTAERFGIDHNATPEQNIKAGVEYLKWLERHLTDSIDDPAERIKFKLAAYNAGLGHVEDVRLLALKYNKNPNIWTDNTDYFMLHKSNPKYYRDSVVKYGYCRGIEPFQYVNNILERYHHYKNMKFE